MSEPISVVMLDSFWHEDPDECAIRYEDDEGFTVHEGECYAHLPTDPACRFQDDARLEAFLARASPKKGGAA